MLAQLHMGQRFDQIHQLRAGALHGVQRSLHHHIDARLDTEILPRHADARAAQAVFVEEGTVIGDR